MSLFERIKNVLIPTPDPVTDFGLEPMQFFLVLLDACPPGSRLTFDQSEPESFVHAFRQSSHRSDPTSFEADDYTIDADFIARVHDLVSRGELELDHHFGISSADGRLLCASWDDFTIVKLADEIREKIQRHIESSR